jgi:hypothetical protein
LTKEKQHLDDFEQDLDGGLFEGIQHLGAFSRLADFKKDMQHEKQRLQIESIKIGS